jgi:hypothetical protein
MTFRFTLLSLLLLGASAASALDREAFSFTNYDLHLEIEPEQHRLGVRGKVTLRNDSQTPQKIAVLQISSSLDWRSVKAGDKPLQFVTQPYTSDIDHTGGLSEAIVTLPAPVAPKETVELDIAYEGVVVLDSTRLTRIGTPADAANSTDWDQIDKKFTAVRGAGYVAWYPIATQVANLSEEDSLFAVLGRWKASAVGAEFKIRITATDPAPESVPAITFTGFRCRGADEPRGMSIDCAAGPLGLDPPSFVIADYRPLNSSSAIVEYLAGHESAASAYAGAADKLSPFIADWFGKPRNRIQIADLPDPNAAPFESQWLLFAPLATTDARLAGLVVAHQLAHASFSSWRPWINEGLAHFAQALYLEQQSGRRAALDYMGLHRSAISGVEPTTTLPRSEDEVNRSLVNTTSEELYRSKAMCVWWMLRDMVGEVALKKAIAAYRPEQDKEPSYMPRLIAAQTQRDLEWFFDDWVYRDRGLPDFKVESAFPRKTLANAYMVTITVDNLGTAGAEVPITVKFAGGDTTKRLEVRAKSKGVIRVEVPAAPQEVVVNDGSVPESHNTNNIFKIEPADK